jgi:hypothetical protein
LPLSEKARIEVYLPDLPAPAYRELLDVLNREFTYTFGGCSILQGQEAILVVLLRVYHSD